jgi:hypothetical protein
VVDVSTDDEEAFQAVPDPRLAGDECHVVEKTEAVALGAGDVVARRPDQAESIRVGHLEDGLDGYRTGARDGQGHGERFTTDRRVRVNAAAAVRRGLNCSSAFGRTARRRAAASSPRACRLARRPSGRSGMSCGASRS